MFDPTSRYATIPTETYTFPDGREVEFVQRRFLPQGAVLPLLVAVTVTDGDRLDLITGRTLGDPTQFWRVCDANDTMNPPDLTDDPGRVLRVPVPQVRF